MTALLIGLALYALLVTVWLVIAQGGNVDLAAENRSLKAYARASAPAGAAMTAHLSLVPRCEHRNGRFVCIWPPHPDEPDNHHYVSEERA